MEVVGNGMIRFPLYQIACDMCLTVMCDKNFDMWHWATCLGDRLRMKKESFSENLKSYKETEIQYRNSFSIFPNYVFSFKSFIHLSPKLIMYVYTVYTHRSFVFHHCRINFVHIWSEELRVIHRCHIFQNLSLSAGHSTYTDSKTGYKNRNKKD